MTRDIRTDFSAWHSPRADRIGKPIRRERVTPVERPATEPKIQPVKTPEKTPAKTGGLKTE
jgi:hypothetical protein